MKKTLATAFLALSLVASGAAANAADSTATPKSPAELFTGEYWVKSSPENKEIYLYGIESAVDIENQIASKQTRQGTKKGKRGTYTLSPFEQGWMDAFPDTTRKEIAAEVDAWYKAHPEQLDRPVLAVIWYEVIQPRLDAQKNK